MAARSRHENSLGKVFGDSGAKRIRAAWLDWIRLDFERLCGVDSASSCRDIARISSRQYDWGDLPWLERGRARSGSYRVAKRHLVFDRDGGDCSLLVADIEYREAGRYFALARKQTRVFE